MNEAIILSIVQFLSYLYAILLGQIFSGIFIVTGKGWGKIRFSDGRFVKAHILFAYAIFDAIVCSVLIFVGSSILTKFLLEHSNLVVGLTIEVVFASFLWFCHTLSLKMKNTLKRYWLAIVVLQAIAILNFYLVHEDIL